MASSIGSSEKKFSFRREPNWFVVPVAALFLLDVHDDLLDYTDDEKGSDTFSPDSIITSPKMKSTTPPLENLASASSDSTAPLALVEDFESFLLRLSLADAEAEITLLRRVHDYYSKFKMYPFGDDFVLLEEFIVDWFEDYYSVTVNVLARKLDKEINKLKKKYEEVTEKISKNLNTLLPYDRLAFKLAFNIWITQPEKEFDLGLDYEQWLNILSISRVVDVVEAETMFFSGIYCYLLETERYPFKNDRDMDNFVKNYFEDEVTGDEITRIAQGLKTKYKEKLQDILKNAGISNPFEQEAFSLAAKIWKFKISS